jgi:ABC-type phosphate/phosphonate transport system substrate-binding protein
VKRLLRRAAVAIPLLIAAAPAHASSATFVVYLPASPVESASRIGEAVTELGTYLNERVRGLDLQVRPFRKGEDAAAHLQAAGSDVALVLAEGSFLLDVPSGLEVVPTFRLVRGGKETHRKVIVVASSNASLRSLADLRGKTFSLAGGAGPGVVHFLGKVVLEGTVSPESWFGKLTVESDELTAAANVLYGRADAALVSEDNPLVSTHLGKELRAVYTSQPLSLPVLAYRAGALGADQRAALEEALDGLARRAEGKKIVDGLRIEGFARIKDGPGRLDRASLLSLPGEEARAPEVALASLREMVLPALAAPEGNKLPFLLGFTVPELPLSGGGAAAAR